MATGESGERQVVSGKAGVPLDAAQRGEGPYVWRFTAFHRWTHAAVIVSFFLLVLTGLPLRYSCTPWAPLLIRFFGGVESAGLLHRVGAVITLGYFTAHLGWLAVRLVRADDWRRLLWGPDSMVPQPRDVVDFFRQFRWYLGRGPRPRFARYSYMEKFDYFAVFWGVAIIGGSGLVLWFPEFFARFLPGWMFNVAAVVHADEAILATTFIFTIHFFNVHLRPDKFPLDAVMFTGRATMEYMEEEHPETAREIAAGLEEAAPGDPRRERTDAVAPPPTRGQSTWAAALGFLALGIGLATIGMMLWSLTC